MKPVFNLLYATYNLILWQGLACFATWLIPHVTVFHPADLKLILKNILCLLVFDFYWWFGIVVIYAILFRRGLSGRLLVFKLFFALSVSGLTAAFLKHDMFGNCVVAFIIKLPVAVVFMVIYDKKLRTQYLSQLFQFLTRF